MRLFPCAWSLLVIFSATRLHLLCFCNTFFRKRLTHTAEPSAAGPLIYTKAFSSLPYYSLPDSSLTLRVAVPSLQLQTWVKVCIKPSLVTASFLPWLAPATSEPCEVYRHLHVLVSRASLWVCLNWLSVLLLSAWWRFSMVSNSSLQLQLARVPFDHV